jgi:hypothetical protein
MADDDIDWQRWADDDEYRAAVREQDRQKRQQAADAADAGADDEPLLHRRSGSDEKKPLTHEEAERERKRFVEFAAAISGVDAERPAPRRKRERELDFD